MPRITAIGEILIDLTQTGYSHQDVATFAANPGGAPANVAVAAARLGASTAFVGKVGQDAFGESLRTTLLRNGVDVSGLLTDPAPTTLAVVSVDGQGERSFSFLRGADRMLSTDEVMGALPELSGILHFGSVSLTADPARSATLAAVHHARSSGALVSYDPNYRPALWDSPEQARDWISHPLPLVDIIKVADDELHMVTGTGDVEESARILAAQGISLILITMGERGAFYRWQDSTGTIPGVSVPVGDTNGAGDTFLGAVLSRLSARGNDPLKGLEREELEDILSYANRAAAFTCRGHGAIPAMPTPADLL